MVAVFLARRLEALGVAITVAEAAGDRGEGEKIVGPSIHGFHVAIGLDAAVFKREADAVPHLGTRHDGWFWPCGTFGADLDGIAFHHHWLRLGTLGGSPDLDRFSLEAMAAREGLFGGGPGRPLTFGFTFDAVKYRMLLQSIALDAGVKRGEVGQADLVIDCSRTDEPGVWLDRTVVLGASTAGVLPRLDQVIFALDRLVALWPRPDIAPAALARFNADMAAAHQEVRDITVARQVLSGGNDAVSDSLAQRIALFEATGEIVAVPGPVRLADWQAVFLGLGLRPRAIHPAVALVPEDDFKRRMARLRTHIQDTVNGLPAFGG